MHAEETQVAARPQARHHQPLLGLGRRRLLHHLGDLVDPLPARHPLPADHAEPRQLALVGGLHPGHRAFLGLRQFDQLPGTADRPAAHEDVVAHQQKKRLVADEVRRTGHRVTESPRPVLRQ